MAASNLSGSILSIDYQDYADCRVVSVTGRVDHTNSTQFLDNLSAHAEEAGGMVVEALAITTETDMASYWKPEPIFFDLLRDKRAINAMIGDIASAHLAKVNLTETGKVQKEILGNRIKGEACEPNPDWRPGWMLVPPSRVIDGAPCLPADKWEKIAAIFGPAIEENSLNSDCENGTAAAA